MEEKVRKKEIASGNRRLQKDKLDMKGVKA